MARRTKHAQNTDPREPDGRPEWELRVTHAKHSADGLLVDGTLAGVMPKTNDEVEILNNSDVILARILKLITGEDAVGSARHHGANCIVKDNAAIEPDSDIACAVLLGGVDSTQIKRISLVRSLTQESLEHIEQGQRRCEDTLLRRPDRCPLCDSDRIHKGRVLRTMSVAGPRTCMVCHCTYDPGWDLGSALLASILGLPAGLAAVVGAAALLRDVQKGLAARGESLTSTSEAAFTRPPSGVKLLEVDFCHELLGRFMPYDYGMLVVFTLLLASLIFIWGGCYGIGRLLGYCGKPVLLQRGYCAYPRNGFCPATGTYEIEIEAESLLECGMCGLPMDKDDLVPTRIQDAGTSAVRDLNVCSKCLSAISDIAIGMRIE